MRISEYKILRKIFGPKGDEQTGKWRKLHKVELYNICGNVDIIRTLKLHRLRWVGHVPHERRKTIIQASSRKIREEEIT